MPNFRRPMEIGLILFLLAQPILDILAYFDIPVSTAVRATAMVACVCYILVFSPAKWSKFVRLYFLVLGTYAVIHITTNLFLKDPFALGAEITHLFKTIYFVCMFLTYLLIFFFAGRGFSRRIFAAMFVNMALIGIVIMIAAFTETGAGTYGMLALEGQTGWFFSGNELSAIMAIGTILAIGYFFYTPNGNVKWLLIMALALVAWAMLTIGTKVAFGGVLIGLGTGVIAGIAEAVTKKRMANLVIFSGMFIMIIAATPYMPIGNNMEVAVDREVANSSPERQEEMIPLQSVLFNGREAFLFGTYDDYVDAPPAQQLFGMGRSGNYAHADEMNAIEMDVFDWFFNYGPIGMLILCFPFVLFGGYAVKNAFRTLSFPLLFAFISSIVGLGAAFSAGHVLSAPAAGIYLAIALSLFVRLTDGRKEENHARQTLPAGGRKRYSTVIYDRFQKRKELR